MTNDSKLVNFIKNYYLYVDNSQLDDLLDLFSHDSYYKRCKLEIRGKAELEKFYKQGRSISGKHSIFKITEVSGNSIIVEGSFDGQWKDGTPLSIHFSDFFFFNQEDKISEGHTYTDQGSV